MSGEEVIKELTTSSPCEVCGKTYHEDDVKIVGHDGEMWVLHVHCGSCHSQSLIAAQIDEDENPGMAPDGKLSDLFDNETEKFDDIIITADDLLDMYNYLEGFSGDFSQLF